MDIRQIRYFTTVCAEGSFSRAAAKLHMTQPPLSTTVAALERELGVKLLERMQHGVVPTDAGAYLAARGEQILRQTEDVANYLRGLGEGREGHIRVAAVPPVVWAFVPELLRRFGEIAPNADVTLTDPPPDAAIESVMRGSADFAIVMTGSVERLAEIHRGQLRVMAIRDLPLKAMLPPTWASSPDPLDALSLQDEPWFLPRRVHRFPGLRELVEELWIGWTGFLPTIREVATTQTAVPLIAGGLGVSLLPAALNQYQDPRIVMRDLIQPVPANQFAVLWRSAVDLSALQRRMLDLMLQIHDDARQ